MGAACSSSLALRNTTERLSGKCNRRFCRCCRCGRRARGGGAASTPPATTTAAKHERPQAASRAPGTARSSERDACFGKRKQLARGER
eukprot:CAMPEP_0175258272 /NCGR_PEP_ID=MMETSP0093-20121207/39143_1 /TAXON_ID=311494 /ORGANISM="Alexandrium monilatum, Strain CCMP3105" /LENGTH=87 /DNA_ID=CAMNT_0016552663 /DNA_START=356 /DNA_END=619 /DNA_ORIENTATION=-